VHLQNSAILIRVNRNQEGLEGKGGESGPCAPPVQNGCHEEKEGLRDPGGVEQGSETAEESILGRK
jgi:hypothetical protein